MKLSTSRKFRYSKWGWVIMFIMVITLIVVAIIKNTTAIPFPIRQSILATYFFISTFYAAKLAAIRRGLPDRIRYYRTLQEEYSKNPDKIKKSILYAMKLSMCENEVVKDLCKEFNIKLENNLI